MGEIRDNVLKLRSEIPQGINIVAAAKSRNAQEILEAIGAGITIVGENYLQESKEMIEAIGKKAAMAFYRPYPEEQGQAHRAAVRYDRDR